MSGRLLNEPTLYVNFEVTEGQDKGFYRIEDHVLHALNHNPILLERRVQDYNDLLNTNMALVVKYARLVGREQDVSRMGTLLFGIPAMLCGDEDRIVRATCKIRNRIDEIRQGLDEVNAILKETGVYGKYWFPAKSR